MAPHRGSLTVAAGVLLVALPTLGAALRMQHGNTTENHGGIASLATLLRREMRAPTPDPNQVKAEQPGGACFEAKVNADSVADQKAREEKLLALYKETYAKCGGGQISLMCLTEAAYDHEPEAYLEKCNRAGYAPYYDQSGAVCRYSKAGMEAKTQLVYRYTHLQWLATQAVSSCARTPLACVMLLNSCLEATDMTFCFRECVRTGNMEHALEPEVPRSKMGEAPPLPLPSGFAP